MVGSGRNAAQHSSPAIIAADNAATATPEPVPQRNIRPATSRDDLRPTCRRLTEAKDDTA